jgi:hypothetical protein
MKDNCSSSSPVVPVSTIVSQSLRYTDLKSELHARGAKIWITQGVDWISTTSGSERPSAKSPLATVRGTDSSPQSRSWRAQHIDQRCFDI